MSINFNLSGDVLWIRDVALSFPAQFLTKSSYNFDMLIMISAFTMAYTVGLRGGKSAFKFILRKYLRITPIIMIATGWLIVLPLAKKMYRGGPTWGDFVPKPASACERNGLYNLLYVQNFLSPTEMCLKNTWLFSVEMQLYLTFVPVLILARKASKPVIVLILTIIVAAGMICNVLTVFKYELPPHLMWTLPDPDQRNFYYEVHYFKPWTHLSIFAVGIGAGLMCKNRSKKSVSSSPFGLSAALLWFASLITIMCLLFTHHDWVLGILPSPLTAGLFDCSHRLILSLACAWIVYNLVVICEDNQDSKLAKILGSRFMVILGRLTIVAYTIHPIVQLIFLGTQSSQLFSGPIVALYVVMGNVILTYFHSFILSILWEIPITSGLKARQMASSQTIMNITSVTSNSFPRNTINNNKSGNSLPVVSSINGDIEMSKHVERL